MLGSTVSKYTLVLAGAVMGGAVAFAATPPATHNTVPVVHQQPAIKISAAPDQYNPTPEKAPVPAPVKLNIPALNVSAVVEALGVTQDYSLEAPQGVSDVGWYSLGSTPGAPGDAIISGHRGYPGGIPAVFNNLGRLHAGDEVDVLFADGHAQKFTVTRVFMTPFQKVPDGFFATEGAPHLTLVTCSGDFDGNKLTYTDRLVVETSPAG